MDTVVFYRYIRRPEDCKHGGLIDWFRFYKFDDIGLILGINAQNAMIILCMISIFFIFYFGLFCQKVAFCLMMMMTMTENDDSN